MGTREEIIKKFDSVKLPDIVLEDHRRELRASLIAEYATQNTTVKSSFFSFIQSGLRSWKAIAATSLVWIGITLLVISLLIIPASQPNSTVLAIDAVMDSPQVKNILVGDAMESVTITPIDNENMEVVVESRGGIIIIASVSIRKRAVTINEITSVTMFGSIFEPEELLSGTEAEKITGIASTNYEFRQLQSKGAQIDKIAVVQTIVTSRNLTTGEIKEAPRKWAMVTLSLQGKYWYFLVDPFGSRVINRSLEAAHK